MKRNNMQLLILIWLLHIPMIGFLKTAFSQLDSDMLWSDPVSHMLMGCAPI